MAIRPKTMDNSISCSFLHPGPKLSRRNCSEARLSKVPTSLTPMSSNPNMVRLKNRLGNTKPSVDPELAAAVVKSYLLPMFEAKSRTSSNKLRPFRLKTEENADSRVKTVDTVYSDLKLNEQLMDEIEEMKKKLSYASQEAKDSMQKLLSNEEAFYKMREENEKQEINIEFLNFQNNQQTKFIQRHEIRSGLIIEQLEKYKKLYQESLSREEELVAKLDQARIENDIRLFLVFSLTLQIN